MPALDQQNGSSTGQKTLWRVVDGTAPGFIPAGCPAPLAPLLASRGIDSADAARRLLEPRLADLHDPMLLLGMIAAVTRIRRAVELGEPILIYGDYDVDGTTATVLLKTAIERIASQARPAQVSYHVPHRLREGYGMQTSRLAQAAADGVRLVISVDTGIRAFAAAEEARSLGLDLIVTDHHLPDAAAGIPFACAVINPAQPGCPYPAKHLCGAAVAFKLAHALLLAHLTTPEQQAYLVTRLIPSLLKLVALATIADSVELTGENRTLAVLGLAALANPVQPGLRALMHVAKLPLDRAPTATEVGFRLGPRINAAGRMDVAAEVVELFLTRDALRAEELAAKLDQLNNHRRATEAEALEAIEEQLFAARSTDGESAPECVVLNDADWHRGVIGILASRVVERTGRPALVLTGDAGDPHGEAHGSGRSVRGFHLLDALTALHADPAGDELFTRFGGHAFAVGFSLPCSRIPELRARMARHSRLQLSAETLAPETLIDAELTADELTLDLVRWIKRLEPFGLGNPEPVFLLRDLELWAEPRAIKERHLCLPLAAMRVDGTRVKLEAKAWSRAGQTPWTERAAGLNLHAGARLDVVGRLCENTHPVYGGIEIELIDLAVLSQPAAQPAVLPVLSLEVQPPFEELPPLLPTAIFPLRSEPRRVL